MTRVRLYEIDSDQTGEPYNSNDIYSLIYCTKQPKPFMSYSFHLFAEIQCVIFLNPVMPYGKIITIYLLFLVFFYYS